LATGVTAAKAAMLVKVATEGMVARAEMEEMEEQLQDFIHLTDRSPTRPIQVGIQEIRVTPVREDSPETPVLGAQWGSQRKPAA
jgi:hypothetical protein